MLNCKICGNEISGAYTIYQKDGVEYPAHIECVEENKQHCDECNKFFDREDLKTTTLGNHYCPDCLSEKTVVCGKCGKHVENAPLKRVNSVSYCQECFEQKWVYCVKCGKRVSRSRAKNLNNTHYCASCASSVVKVENYSYKPTPIFCGVDSSRYFGIEVETEGRESNLYAEEIIGGSKIFYAKHDGSLNNGIEFVSHPCTLNYWREESKLDEFCKRAIGLGFNSHKTTSCGLHVHITKSTVEREAFEKVLLFLSNNWDDVVKFTRRKSSSINRWAANNLGDAPMIKTYTLAQKMKLVKEYFSGSRYVAVNETSKTYEFRIFRGTLKPETILACIEFCDALINLCASLPFANIETANFNTLIEFAKPKGCYKELVEYWETRTMKKKNVVIG